MSRAAKLSKWSCACNVSVFAPPLHRVLMVNKRALTIGASVAGGSALGGVLLATGGYALLGAGALILGVSSAVVVAWSTPD
jgi:predicted MFS family arabinose efflux permease